MSSRVLMRSVWPLVYAARLAGVEGSLRSKDELGENGSN